MGSRSHVFMAENICLVLPYITHRKNEKYKNESLNPWLVFSV